MSCVHVGGLGIMHAWGRIGCPVYTGRGVCHGVHGEGCVSWCAQRDMDIMVCSGRNGFHLYPTGLEATGRGRSCSLSTEQTLTLDCSTAQDFPVFFSPHVSRTQSKKEKFTCGK